ncbi:MAG: transposase [bacterium]
MDEKTGIQALERKAPTAAMKKGKVRRIETEYARHGTICLMAAFDVGKGNILNHWTNSTRKEADFLFFTDQTTQKLPAEDKIIFLLDQLNTHMSESLVIWVARQIGFTGDLGIKGRKGILKNKQTRMAFLKNSEHRIRFVFTPKHCSWLNPVENWFSKLQAHVIKYGNFSSVNELENKINRYVDYYNKCLVKPLKWKFKGFIKAHKLYGLKLRA